MPASTSTITTAKSKGKTKTEENARLRVSPEAEESVGLQEKGEEKKGWEKHEKDFFWTYTEEPHRTRRMAIIKAHPEVCSPLPFAPPPHTSPIFPLLPNQDTDALKHR
jgi:sphingolipid delta-4 desaturase